MEPARIRVKRATFNQREGEDHPGLRFSDTTHPRILQKTGEPRRERQIAKLVLALPPAELEVPALVLDATVLSEKKNLELTVHFPTTQRGSGKM